MVPRLVLSHFNSSQPRLDARGVGGAGGGGGSQPILESVRITADARQGASVAGGVIVDDYSEDCQTVL
jgi:hypothetical protein